jgi:hypothetical protein
VPERHRGVRGAGHHAAVRPPTSKSLFTETPWTGKTAFSFSAERYSPWKSPISAGSNHTRTITTCHANRQVPSQSRLPTSPVAVRDMRDMRDMAL